MSVAGMSVGRYEPKDRTVEAIQWLGEENCEVVFAFLGLEHPDDETDHDEIILPGTGYSVSASNWIVKWTNGRFGVLHDKTFRRMYEAAE